MHLVTLSILCGILVTAAIRVFPIMFFSNRVFPEKLKAWLTFVPPAIFTAIVINEVLNSKDISMFGLSVGFLAALFSFLVGLIFRNLFSAVLASIVFYLFFQYYKIIFQFLHISI